MLRPPRAALRFRDQSLPGRASLRAAGAGGRRPRGATPLPGGLRRPNGRPPRAADPAHRRAGSLCPRLGGLGRPCPVGLLAGARFLSRLQPGWSPVRNDEVGSSSLPASLKRPNGFVGAFSFHGLRLHCGSTIHEARTPRRPDTQPSRASAGVPSRLKVSGREDR